MKLPLAINFQNLHTYSLSTQGVEIELIFTLRGAVSEMQAEFQNCSILAWNWAIWPKFQKLHIYMYSQGVEIELIFALWSAFSEIQADFLNCHIWAWTLPIRPKFQKLHIYSLSTPERGGGGWGGEIDLIFGLRAVVPEIRANFQNCHILAWNLASRQSSRSYALFLPQGVKMELIFALQAAVSKMQANFPNRHIWAWNLASGQSARSCTYIT